MEYITLKLSDLHKHGSAFFDYLALRKQFFVDTLNWTIPHDDAVEMDQYDNPQARYSIVLHNGKVIAGARAMPTTAHWGDTTYMLRDAYTGKIGGIPSDLMDHEIVSTDMWECTRLVICPSVKTMAERTQCLRLICQGLVEMARAEGATELMSLSNLWLLRALKSIGYKAELMCKPYTNSEDGHRYAVMKIDADLLETHVPVHVPTHPPAQPAVVHSPAK